jgi:hypothetical protein
MPQEVINLINQAVNEAHLGHRQQSQFIFGKVLERDPQNEIALLWLAFLTPNPFVAADLLGGLFKRNPADERVCTYLAKARARCAELSVSTSLELKAAPPGTFRLKASSRAYEYRDIGPSNRSVPYLGEFLMQEGYITQHQLNVALRTHYDMALRGQPKRVGEVLIQLGYLTPGQLEHSLVLQQAASGEVCYS